MTVVCWDGKTLAADRRSVLGSTIYPVTKIWRIRGCLVGGAGDFERINEMAAWFAAGENPEKLPPFQRDNNDFASLLVIQPGGVIMRYDRGPIPFKIESRHYSIGSGREYAATAMHLGKTAKEAVEITSELDMTCGNGVDTLEFE